jgi:alpha-beta hydrolase superfamily lysophospholipase
MGTLSTVQSKIKSPVDGLDLVFHSWTPAANIKRLMVIQHGFGEHGLRYQFVIDALDNGSTAFFALDARGHGSSPGIRGHADSFQDFVLDLNALVEQLKSQYPGVPIALFGHSMGGGIVLDYCLTDDFQKNIQFLIVSAAALRIKMTTAIRIKKFIGKKLANFMPSQVIAAGLDPGLISQDADIVQAYIDDPKVHGKISLAMGSALFAVGERVLSRASGITIPTYVFHGTGDELCMPAGSEELFSKLGSEEKKLKFYPNLHHETFNEKLPERNQVLKDLADWVNQRK